MSYEYLKKYIISEYVVRVADSVKSALIEISFEIANGHYNISCPGISITIRAGEPEVDLTPYWLCNYFAMLNILQEYMQYSNLCF